MKQLAHFLILLLSLPALATADDRPNIIFLMADDQCTYSMGCYGTPGVKTPNLDQLARDGMIFDNHYDTTAICMASRANVMTGMYEYKTGCNFEHGALLIEHWQKSYPILLRKAGYQTAFAGKIGFEVAEQPEARKASCRKATLIAGVAVPGKRRTRQRRTSRWPSTPRSIPHSTLSYGAFGRDFVQRCRQTEATVLSVDQFQSSSQTGDARSPIR